MSNLDHLFENNRAWAARMTEHDLAFFTRLAEQQRPESLWIGCADSRVPANEIVGLLPGELFVHRNVANLISHTDLNSLAVLQYAIEVLQVLHVIVCGHYGCGGVQAALEGSTTGLVHDWLAPLRDVARAHTTELPPSEPARLDRLCELNVMAQVRTVAQTAVVQAAWRHGQPLQVHGWIYDIRDGLLKDLAVTEGV